MTNALLPSDRSNAALSGLTQLFDLLEGVASELPPEDATALRSALQFGREQVNTLQEVTVRQAEVIARTMGVAVTLRQQRDRHARQYADLVEAVETADQQHPLVGMLFEAYMNTDSNIIDQLERALGDPDAAATVADLALGRGRVDPDELDRLIEVLSAMRERQEVR